MESAYEEGKSSPPHEGSPLVGAPAEAREMLWTLLSWPYKFAIASLTLVSFVLNIYVLFPVCTFVRIDAEPAIVYDALHAGDWGIFHTIDELRQFGLYGIVVIIYAFSICFPFIKLAWIVGLLVVPTSEAVRACHVRYLGQLGRWSLLDVLVVLLLLIVFADQQTLSLDVDIFGWEVDIPLPVTISALVREGIFVFSFAILCAVAAGALLELAVEPIRATPRTKGERFLLCARFPASGAACVASAVTGFAATVAAFFAPILTVTGVSPSLIGGETSDPTIAGLLNENTWSVWTALVAQAADDALMGLFLAILLFELLLVPCAMFGALLWLQCVPRDHASIASLRLATFISTLCLPEVLLFAYIVYIAGIAPSLIRVDLGDAFWWLCVYVVAELVGLVSGAYSVKAALREGL